MLTLDTRHHGIHCLTVDNKSTGEVIIHSAMAAPRLGREHHANEIVEVHVSRRPRRLSQVRACVIGGECVVECVT